MPKYWESILEYLELCEIIDINLTYWSKHFAEAAECMGIVIIEIIFKSIISLKVLDNRRNLNILLYRGKIFNNENWIVSFVRNNIWIPYVYQFPHLHTVHNPQLDLIKTGFHHTQRASHSRDSTRRSFGVPESLPFSRCYDATKFHENSHRQHNFVTFLNH